jgi:predicted enzyme related to lactoylglutathione lyase
MKIKYVTVPSGDVAEEETFFVKSLGFEHKGELEIWPNIHCKLLSNNDSDIHIAIIPDRSILNSKAVVIFNTENCLKQYHEMAKNGVSFNHKPHYVSAGMTAEFTDKEGNQFILLEERSYTED